MILACTIMGFAILWLPAYSQIETQTDSLQNAKETEQDTVVKYLTPMEYALMMHEETSWLFKIDFPAQSKLSSIKLGIEKMIAPSFSLNLETRFYTNFYGEKFYSYYIYALLESRWYYRMNKRVNPEVPHNRQATT